MLPHSPVVRWIELSIQIVFALSPQVKGQTRAHGGYLSGQILVTELRLVGATTIEEANVVLKDFLVRFKTRFGVVAQHPEVAYRPLEPDACLDSVLCFRHRRKVARDNTVKYRSRTLRLLPVHGTSQIRRNNESKYWMDWTVSWLCGTRERSFPARRRRPVLAYS